MASDQHGLATRRRASGEALSLLSPTFSCYLSTGRQARRPKGSPGTQQRAGPKITGSVPVCPLSTQHSVFWWPLYRRLPCSTDVPSNDRPWEVSYQDPYDQARSNAPMLTWTLCVAAALVPHTHAYECLMDAATNDEHGLDVDDGMDGFTYPTRPRARRPHGHQLVRSFIKALLNAFLPSSSPSTLHSR
ncbi:hypothetical protein PLICRDRAFT_424773 [Plicaturopsis crispa FD-325 SS-3]|nr:hypothetical protein PLICRDRAFT_424773 [Plicaturopsis crispa FD-325 SS-3]